MSLTDGVIAFYHMNSGWTDASGNGHNGSATGSIIDTTNKHLGAGSGFHDGTDDFVNLGALGTLGSDLNDGATIAFWVKTTDATADIRIFGAIEELGVNDRVFEISYNRAGAGLLNVNCLEGGDQLQKRTTADIGIDDGNFHAIIVSIKTSDNTVAMYVDNSTKALTDISLGSPTMSDFDEDFYMGALNNRGTDDLHIGCNLDELVIASRIWTSDDRDEFWNSGAGVELDAQINSLLVGNDASIRMDKMKLGKGGITL